MVAETRNEGYLVLVQEITPENKKIVDDITIVQYFSDVFPEDFPELPPLREVEFTIDLVINQFQSLHIE